MDIVLHEKLYRDGISNWTLRRIRKKVKRKSVNLKWFFVTLPLGDNGILEVYWYPELLQKAYKELDKSLTVVGIAKSREDAFALIEEIITDVGWDCGKIPINDFFKEKR